MFECNHATLILLKLAERITHLLIGIHLSYCILVSVSTTPHLFVHLGSQSAFTRGKEELAEYRVNFISQSIVFKLDANKGNYYATVIPSYVLLLPVIVLGKAQYFQEFVQEILLIGVNHRTKVYMTLLSSKNCELSLNILLFQPEFFTVSDTEIS